MSQSIFNCPRPFVVGTCSALLLVLAGALGCSGTDNPQAPSEEDTNAVVKLISDGEELARDVTGLPDRDLRTASDILAKHKRVVINCYLVRDAAEVFAADNGGVYPVDVGADLNLSGKNLIDLLPEGILLVNPFHLVRTEPISGAAAVEGETGYVPVVTEGSVTGYVITGAGMNGAQILVIEN